MRSTRRQSRLHHSHNRWLHYLVAISWVLVFLAAAQRIYCFYRTPESFEQDLDATPAEPSLEYELNRRRIVDGVKEMWYFYRAELEGLKNISINYTELQKMIDNTTTEGLKYKRILLHNAEKLSKVDGYSKWRKAESKSLSELVQSRLHILQNPPTCDAARKLVCDMEKDCGFGCQSSYVFFCMLAAYASQRTMILRSEGWRYHAWGFEDIFQPLSRRCFANNTAEASGAFKDDNNNLVLLADMSIKSQSPPPKWHPMSVPGDLALRLARLHGDPFVWFAGQILRFLYRPQPSTMKLFEDTKRRLRFTGHVVGVHVRRTDKVGVEADFHPLSEYMQHVDEYFTQLELSQKVDRRRVYIASDDPTVHEEARVKYPKYDFLADPAHAESANLRTRFSSKSFFGLITDIYLLSRTEFIVCTFSSSICRMSYETMQTLHPDASDRFRSLDDIYWVAGQASNERVAVLEHNATSNATEIDLKVGDVITIAGNLWNGFSIGKNYRTGKTGRYPSHKVIKNINANDFSTIYNKIVAPNVSIT